MKMESLMETRPPNENACHVEVYYHFIIQYFIIVRFGYVIFKFNRHVSSCQHKLIVEILL